MVWLQSMMILTLTGQYSRKIFRGLSVGHIFLGSIGYITMWLFNLLGCTWIWLASVEGKENSWMQQIGNLPLSPLVQPVLHSCAQVVGHLLSFWTLAPQDCVPYRALGQSWFIRHLCLCCLVFVAGHGYSSFV